jgi:alkylation response protein AidB-like acyl-CoA dehydrogenase
MILADTAEHERLRASVRQFLAERVPLSAVRGLMDTADGCPAVWAQAGQQLGLQGIAIPEDYDGAGFTFAEQAIVLEDSVPRSTVGRTWPARSSPPARYWPATTRQPRRRTCPPSPPAS